MSCAAFNCTNRFSRESSVKFHRFPLADKGRLQKWLVNLRRYKFKPTPSSRLCSLHFEDRCFFTNSQGHVRLAKTAVPTIFSFPDHIQKHSHRTRVRQGTAERRAESGCNESSSQEFHTYCLRGDARKDFPGTVQFVKEEAGLEPEVDGSGGSLKIYPSEICVISVRHDHCYRSESHAACRSMDDVDMEAESAETLKHNLLLVQGKLEACRKQLKLKSATIRRLKRKVTSLSSIISEMKAKDIIDSKNECYTWPKQVPKGSRSWAPA